jgi:hypothetical protein
MKRSSLTKLWLVSAFAVAFLVAGAAQAGPDAQGRCPGNRSANGGMWLSIAHPGVGEYFLKGWGPWSNMPPLKFWLGFIPIYGWPGYLQVKSAVDAANCRTNDSLRWGE